MANGFEEVEAKALVIVDQANFKGLEVGGSALCSNGFLLGKAPGNCFDWQTLVGKRKAYAPAVRAEAQIVISTCEVEQTQWSHHLLAPVAWAAVCPKSTARDCSLTTGAVLIVAASARSTAGRARMALNQRLRWGKSARFCCWR